MTKIVKSFAVVDDRPEPQEKKQAEAIVSGMPVIKRRIVAQGVPAQPMGPPTKQGFLDELNRLKVEISKAKAELRSVQKQRGALEAGEPGLPAMESIGGKSLAEDTQEKARQQAQQILAGARAEAGELREQSKQEGYLEGFHKGYEEAKTEYYNENQPKAARLQQLLNALSAYQKEQIEKDEANVVNLVVEIAGKIIGREIRQVPDTVADMLYSTIDDNRQEAFIRVSIAPDLLPAQASASEEVRGIIAAMGGNITVITDAELEPGGLIVETPKGYTDLSVNTQLNNISDILNQA